MRRRNLKSNLYVNPQGLYQWLPIALVTFVAYKLYTMFFAPGSILGQSDQESKNEDSVNSVSVNYYNANITEAKALILANRLKYAMNPGGEGFADMDGTKEDEIFKVFAEIINKDDMKAVYKKFGVKKYPVLGFNMFADAKDLLYWLNKELSETEIQPIQNKLSWIS